MFSSSLNSSTVSISTVTNTPLDAPLPSTRSVFINANLVGFPEGETYSVLVDGGKVSAIRKGVISTDGATVVDLKQADGSSHWLSPVTTSGTTLYL
jgi:hypothetical protein